MIDTFLLPIIHKLLLYRNTLAQAEELAAALRASQNVGQADPADVVSCA